MKRHQPEVFRHYLKATIAAEPSDPTMTVATTSPADVGRALVARMQQVVADQAIRLDPVTHTYYKGALLRGSGQPVLGVTTILKRAGVINDRWWTEDHCQRGTDVHTLAWLQLDGLTGEWGQYDGYRQSFNGFLDLHRPDTIATDVLVYHAEQDYCGTLDWFVVAADQLAIWDLKSGRPANWHACQTAGYADALLSASIEYPAGMVPPSIRRGSVYLFEDGRPGVLRQHYKPTDRVVWQAALVCACFAENGR